MYPLFAIFTIVGVLFCGLTIDIGIMETNHLQIGRASWAKSWRSPFQSC
jgi:hypothetical protein